MAMRRVELRYLTGVKREIFRNARLRGSWDAAGRYADLWMESPMRPITGEDGSPAFAGEVLLDDAQGDRTFHWGVVLDGPQGASSWGIPTELHDARSVERYRSFRLAPGPDPQVERYHLTWLRRVGANRFFAAGAAAPTLRFAVWAPNARSVQVVFGLPDSGYIGDDGRGINPDAPVLVLARAAGPAWDGIWQGDAPGSYDDHLSRPYMFRIRRAEGDTVYRTDIFSRSQIGRGHIDPAHASWPGTIATLDGTVSCSVVIDPDVVRRTFAPTPPDQPPDRIPAEEFWATELLHGTPVPGRLEELVIYELHVGSLGFGKPRPGDLGDALQLLDHLVELGVNAVELLPIAEFSGNAAWGYGDSHHLCIESSAGGRDQYRHFVRECHRRGIAVIQDVVYNHYDPNAERAEWQYDASAPEKNIYYWYEGLPAHYTHEDGGYLDNGSSGFTPRFHEEAVRQQLISSAVFLVEEMHVDGLRVDLTQAIHRDNHLHGSDHREVGDANLFGHKLLREWSRTLRMIRPNVMLIAEDHTGWPQVIKPPAGGGLGFDATWEVGFYHSLIGDSEMAGGDAARLLKHAGFGAPGPLAMGRFAGALLKSREERVVFHESHDEAGNARGTARTLVTAVNGAPLAGATRDAAEARARVSFGLALFSAGTPMFLMGEEIGARMPYTYDGFLAHREDILGEKLGHGARLFRFYREAIAVSRRLPSVRGRELGVLHAHDENRVIAFKRWRGLEQVIVVASLNDRPFASGYGIAKDPVAIPDGGWKEIFNSDAAAFGGANVGNGGATLPARDGRVELVLPANGFVVLVRQ